MIDAIDIIKKFERLPYEKQLAVGEFIDFLEHKTACSTTDYEMNTAEILQAAERTGSFDFLHDPSENIYTLNDGAPL